MKQFILWCEQKQKTLGIWTLSFGTMMAVIGFPVQIWKTIADQRCGLHWFLVMIPLGIYSVRIPYSVGKKAWALIVPDIIGFLSCLTLLALYFYYT